MRENGFQLKGDENDVIKVPNICHSLQQFYVFSLFLPLSKKRKKEKEKGHNKKPSFYSSIIIINRAIGLFMLHNYTGK